jgi:hypothetical protein
MEVARDAAHSAKALPRSSVAMTIPTPTDLGFPPKFADGWRANQVDALERLLRSQRRVKALSAPTGSGKSGIYVAYALITRLKAVFVTESRALQAQLMADFKSVGMVSLSGRKNYDCGLKPDFTCEEGYAARCPYKGSIECPSSRAEMKAAASQLVVTNYAKWMSAFPPFTQLVVFDEAHAAPDAIASSMQVVLHDREIAELGLDFPSQADDFPAWKPWIAEARAIADNRMLEFRARLRNGELSQSKKFLHYNNLCRRLATVATARPESWVVEDIEKGFQFDPVRVGRYAEAVLLVNTPSVLMVSATLRPKTLYLIGIPTEGFDFFEYQSEFDPARCPIYYVPTDFVDQKHPDNSALWIKLDQIIARRLDRKGIVHTVSYKRRDEVLRASRFRSQMMWNPQDAASTGTVERFKAAPPGTILVSPSVGGGFDFPGCVTPHTKILTADLLYVPAGNLAVGQRLLAFDDTHPDGRRGRQWGESFVLSNTIGRKECTRLTFDDGSALVCSSDHPLLRYSGNRAARWKKAIKLRPFRDYIARLLPYWEPSPDRWAGYLAGIWDGEGHLSQRLNEWRSGGEMPHISLGMSQVENSVLMETLRLLTDHGYDTSLYRSTKTQPSHQDKIQVLISKRGDMLRFLGECRPTRILSKLDINMLGSIRPAIPIMVVGNEYLGMMEVSILSTSTKTYVSNGIASHNSDCEWQFICKVPFPDGRSKIMKARQEDDKEYGPYVTMNKLVQMCGRPMRSKEDQAETFLVDRHMEWFIPKFRHLAPKSFHQFLRRVTNVPSPPPRL